MTADHSTLPHRVRTRSSLARTRRRFGGSDVGRV